tara:strand:+ start:289 stop:447 length:159 start_codon:yes stop_codon:yes gene_type:complete
MIKINIRSKYFFGIIMMFLQVNLLLKHLKLLQQLELYMKKYYSLKNYLNIKK